MGACLEAVLCRTNMYIYPLWKIQVRGGASHTTERDMDESMQDLTPIPKVPSRGQGGEEWGCLGAGKDSWWPEVCSMHGST